jgi:hypothetical protein
VAAAALTLAGAHAHRTLAHLIAGPRPAGSDPGLVTSGAVLTRQRVLVRRRWRLRHRAAVGRGTHIPAGSCQPRLGRAPRSSGRAEPPPSRRSHDRPCHL